MDPKLEHIFLLSIEEADDYIFTLSGVVIVLENRQFTVYCQSSNHNLFRQALSRHSWEELVKGVVHRGVEFRLTPISDEMYERGWTHASFIPSILKYLYSNNRRHLFFLERALAQLTE